MHNISRHHSLVYWLGDRHRSCFRVVCEISGSHGGEYEDNGLLVYSAV
jgi:hypothetical protein